MSPPDRQIRPFSDHLMEAAARIDELPQTQVARLLVRAAIQLRLIHAATHLEHIPVAAYHLLRRLSREPARLASLHGRDDRALVDFLVSRNLAQRSGDSAREAMLVITPEGEELGTIAEERRMQRH